MKKPLATLNLKIVKKKQIALTSARKSFIRTTLAAKPTAEFHKRAETMSKMAKEAKTASFLDMHRIASSR